MGASRRLEIQLWNSELGESSLVALGGVINRDFTVSNFDETHVRGSLSSPDCNKYNTFIKNTNERKCGFKNKKLHFFFSQKVSLIFA